MRAHTQQPRRISSRQLSKSVIEVARSGGACLHCAIARGLFLTCDLADENKSSTRRHYRRRHRHRPRRRRRRRCRRARAHVTYVQRT
jgi:hypothetical protein